MTREWLDLPLDRVVAPAWAFHHGDEALLAKLTASVEHHGQVQALVVRPLPDGRYEVVQGRQLLEALRRAGVAHAHACSLGASATLEAAHRVALALELRFGTDYVRLAGLVGALAGTYGTPGEAAAGLARTLPFTPDQLLHFVALLTFDWDRFREVPEPQGALDWGVGATDVPMPPPAPQPAPGPAPATLAAAQASPSLADIDLAAELEEQEVPEAVVDEVLEAFDHLRGAYDTPAAAAAASAAIVAQAVQVAPQALVAAAAQAKPSGLYQPALFGED